MTKNNQSILKNYAYLSLFESKYAVYYNERIAASMENILEVLQHIFLRDITDKEYSNYLCEIVMIGTYVIKKSAEFNNKQIHNVRDIKLIEDFLNSAKRHHDNRDYYISVPQFENLLKLMTGAISDNEQQGRIKITSDKISSINMKIFSKEYDMLFHCININEDIYALIESVEEIKFPDDEISSVISRDTAIHEIHQGFTHLTRHVNHMLSNTREIERFKSHIKRAALDLLKLSIESMRVFFIKSNQINLHNEMSIKLSAIKNQEVSEIVSVTMPNFKYKYTTLINEYTGYIK